MIDSPPPRCWSLAVSVSALRPSETARFGCEPAPGASSVAPGPPARALPASFRGLVLARPASTPPRNQPSPPTGCQIPQFGLWSAPTAGSSVAVTAEVQTLEQFRAVAAHGLHVPLGADRCQRR